MADIDNKLSVWVSDVTSGDADQDIIDSLEKYGLVAGVRREQNTGASSLSQELREPILRCFSLWMW